MRIFLITGATSGFGLATAKVILSEEDAKIISISRSKEKIEKAKLELGKDASKVEFLQGDISNFAELEIIQAEIDKKYGKIDVLINNAGTIKAGGLETLSPEDIDWVLKNNLSSYFYTTKAFLPLLKKGKDANIVNISSISAKIGGSSIAYSVAKAGVNMLTQSSAKELAKYSIRVNAVSPGIAKTGFQVVNNIVKVEDYDELLEKNRKDYPLGTVGESMDVAEMVYFLTTKKAKWMTGSNVLIDGGRCL